MESPFLEKTSLIQYSQTTFERQTYSSIEDIELQNSDGCINWINTYGINFIDELKQVISSNSMDDFLLKLVNDNDHPNKVIELDDVLFVTIKVLKTEGFEFDSEQMIFIVSHNFIWSVQEKKGDYFQWIRDRLESNIGISRKKRADYLLFLLLESIVDNYQETYEKYYEKIDKEFNVVDVNPTPEFTLLIEQKKGDLYSFKKAAMSLRDILVRLEKSNIKNFNAKYFSELKEQTINVISDVDYDLQALESKLNLIFSIQGHRLNEVMKTLTIFSVVFIPLTFMAGIYGMNFINMPELQTKYGYFVLLGLMVFITIISVWYFSRKKWF